MSAGGGVLTFTVAGGVDQGRRFLDAIRMCSLTANLGDTRTIVTHPASTTHQQVPPADREAMGVGSDMIRISVGIETVADIIDDLDQALEVAS